MGFGQYSAGGGLRRTKAEMVEIFKSKVDGLDADTARKAGHNRLVFDDAAGNRYFALHETVVATFSADRTRLTLADGGWHTLTTKAAWGDACAAFGIEWWARWSDMPGRGEREVAYVVVPNDAAHDGREVTRWNPLPRPLKLAGRAVTAPDHPLIRAYVSNGWGAEDNFAVHYDGREIISDAEVRIAATPFRVLIALYRIDAMARATHKFLTYRSCILAQFGFKAFGFTVCPGQSSRITMIGCHAFKTQDIRATMRQIERLYPDAVKPAKAFVRRHPLDYGVAAYKAAHDGRRSATFVSA